jgi:subtilisin-like proprotein convertase family protein
LLAGGLTNFAGVRLAQPTDFNSSNNVASLTVPVIDREILITGTATLLDEGFVPHSGGAEPFEPVTLGIALRNIGITDSSSLVATLRSTPSVAPSSSQNYGVLVAGGPALTRPFTFVPSGLPGATLNLIFDLTNGISGIGTVTVPIVLGGTQQFSSSAGITVLDNGPADPYPSIIDVNGVTGIVRHVTVTLRGITHRYPDDLDILLVAPDGTTSILMSDCGGSHSISNVTITIDDLAADSIPDFDQILPGTYQPTDHQSGDVFPSPEFDTADLFLTPAPGGPYPATLSVFNGLNANGTWSLFVLDDFTSDAGQIQGWDISFATVGYPNRPRVRQIVVVGGQCQLNVDGQPGDHLFLESSPDLNVWSPLADTVLTGSSFKFFDQALPDSVRFYRVYRQP